MRPTISEQLGGTCRILEEVVAPELGDTHAGETLRGLVKNLRMLEASWGAVLPFLHWDNAATTQLLRDARPGVGEDLGARIAAADREPDPDPVDVDAVEARNDRLRALLSEAIAVVDSASPVHAAIAEHLAVRTRRYPLRMVPDQPKPATTKAS